MSTHDVGLTESRGTEAGDVIEAIRKTVLVDFAPPEAFDLFTTKIASWWPVRTHSYGGDAVKNLILEPRLGGRLYEITEQGEQDWGTVLAWEPPARLLLDWQIGSASGTEVEVTFAAEGPGSRVVLEHRGFEALDPRDRYESGWDVVLAPFVDHATN